jgi:membrane protein
MAVIKFLKQVFAEFGEDKVGQLSAAFAYVAVFSIGPLLLVLISVLSLIFGEKAAQGQLYSHLAGAVGDSTAKTLQSVVAHSHQSGSGPALFAGIIGVLLAAAALTTQLQNSLNTIFKIVPDPAAGLKRAIYVKVKNVLITLLAGLAAAASVVVTALISGLGDRLRDYFGLPPFVLELINNLVSLGVFVLILYLLYRVVPDVHIPRRVVLVTSLIVSLLFLIGKIVLGIIIGHSGTASAYGAAASLVTLLLWIYYSAQILFLGAEGMKVYAFHHSLVYRPKKHSLKRDTIHIDHHGLPGRLTESFVRGFKKKAD